MFKKALELFNQNTFFIRLFLSFLLVILLIASYNFLSFTFFNNNLREEIIKYNRQNVENTAESFENSLSNVRSNLYRLHFNENLQNYNSQYFMTDKINFLFGQSVISEIRQIIRTNPSLGIVDILIYLPGTPYMLNQSGNTHNDLLFSNTYKSKDYSKSFWLKEFNNNNNKSNFKIYPVSTFKDQNSSAEQRLLPIRVTMDYYGKTITYLVLINFEKLLKNTHYSINNYFIIIDSEKQTIAMSEKFSNRELPPIISNEGYYIEEDYYFFYKNNMNSGLTYINIIPVDNISSGMKKLNILLLVLLIAAVIISIFISVLFTVKMNNPIRKLVDSLQQTNKEEAFTSNIKEFNVINSNIKEMIKNTEKINQDLEAKKSIVMNYAFINKIKNIQDKKNSDLEGLEFNNKPFHLVIFDVSLKNDQHDDVSSEEVIYVIKELILKKLEEDYSNSVTLQIEKNQILSVVFLEEDEPSLEMTLHYLKETFNINRHQYLISICISDCYDQSSHMTKAYERTKLLQLKKRLLNESQILNPTDSEKKNVTLTTKQEQEFQVYLDGRNYDEVNNWIEKTMDYFEKKEAFASDYVTFANYIVKRIKRNLITLGITIDDLELYVYQLDNCYSSIEFKRILIDLIKTVKVNVESNSSQEDKIISFVTEYIEEHLAETVSLDIIAGHLKISSGYLSSYFKEKTGTNFIDFLNNCRIKRSKELLIQTDDKIQDVSIKVGYHNVNSFIRLFKKYTGTTPGKYRKKSIQINDLTG